MAKNQTSRLDYEEYLNEVGDSLSEDEFIIAGKQRTNNHNYGALVHRLDPVAFTTGWNEWKREKQGHL